MKYAESTTVSSEKSKAEIEKILNRYGATSFLSGWNENTATIMFKMEGRTVRFLLPLPKKSDFSHTPGRGKLRSPDAQLEVYEQAIRQRWRALALVIKAKLEAVESGITVFEDEFMAHIVMPNGETVGSWMRPQIAKAYESGKMPPLMLPENFN
jgi:hypothetical protein